MAHLCPPFYCPAPWEFKKTSALQWAPLPHSLGDQPKSEFCALLDLSSQPVCCIPNTARIHSSQERNHQGAPGLEQSALRVGTPLGLLSWENKMAHARERAFPVLSSSCFRNSSETPHRPRFPPQMGAWETQSLFQTKDCTSSRGHLLHVQTLLPLA